MSDFAPLWPGGPIFSDGGAFPLGMDAVVLADFAARRLSRGMALCDLGCGSGAVALLLLEKEPTASAVGVELDGAAALAARQNLSANGWEDRGSIIAGDLRDHRGSLARGAFSLAVSNPPYFPAGSGGVAAGARGAARSETDCTLADLCAAAAWGLRPGGSFCLVHRPERLTDLLCALRSAGLEPKRARLVQHGPDFAPSLVLVEGRRGGKPGLDIEKPLILKDRDGGDSAELRRIYHM